MLIAETVVIVNLLCTSTKRRRSELDQEPQYTTNSIAWFEVASGRTLEGKMTSDIEEMPGVVEVRVMRTGDTFDVFVVMENMEFGPFNAVIQKELELYAKFPRYTFNFDLTPVMALEPDPALSLHAA